MKNDLKNSLGYYKAKKLNIVLVMLFIMTLTFLLTANFYNKSYAVDESTAYSETSSKNYSSTTITTTKEYTTTKYTTTTTAKYDEDYDYEDEDEYQNEYNDENENNNNEINNNYIATTVYDYYEIDENIYHSTVSSKSSSSSYKSSSNTNSVVQTSSNKTPNEINSQDWDQLLANLSSDTKGGKHFTFSDIDLYDSDSKNNGSWILWIGILLIFIAILGISWVVYTEFISKKSPRKMRAAAMARIAAKKASAAHIAKSSANKNISSNNINSRGNEYGDSYTTRRKPPEARRMTRQVVTQHRAEDRLNRVNNNYYNNQRNIKTHTPNYTTYPQNMTKKTSSSYNQDKTFWDNFFGK